jgi:hypothetical protein
VYGKPNIHLNGFSSALNGNQIDKFSPQHNYQQAFGKKSQSPQGGANLNAQANMSVHDFMPSSASPLSFQQQKEKDNTLCAIVALIRNLDRTGLEIVRKEVNTAIVKDDETHNGI